MHTIDYKTHHGMTYAQLLDLYGLMSLAERRRKHQLCLMYRLSHNLDYIDRRRPDINLRSNQKVKFLLFLYQLEEHVTYLVCEVELNF